MIVNIKTRRVSALCAAAAVGTVLSALSFNGAEAQALRRYCEYSPTPGCVLAVPGDPQYGVILPDPADGTLLPQFQTPIPDPPNPGPPPCLFPDQCG